MKDPGFVQGLLVGAGGTGLTVGVAHLVALLIEVPFLGWIGAAALLHAKAFGLTQWCYLLPTARAAKRGNEPHVSRGFIYGGLPCLAVNVAVGLLGK